VIEYRAAQTRDYDTVRQFLANNGWEKRVADADRFRIMMENASRTVVAFERGRIVGFARALCDEVSNGYIGTVAVAEGMRGQGIGRELIQRLMGDDPNITWVLRSGRGSGEFWRKMGFDVSTVAMELQRKV
jgi:N-acetylglutamate synthase-like GNAT family acetyltransferase